MIRKRILSCACGILMAGILVGCASTNTYDTEDIDTLREQVEQLTAENQQLKEKIETLEKDTNLDNGELSETDFVPELSGVCGLNATWEYGNGVLYIHGSGEMTDFGYDSSGAGNIPWGNILKDVIEVRIDDEITHIGANAFSLRGNYPGYSALTKIHFPEKLLSIGKEAFYECGQLDTLILPNGLKSIGESAFYKCDKISNIVLPDRLEELCDYSFQNCKQLSSVKMPNSLKYIGTGVFTGSSLSAIELPDNLESISKHTFFEQDYPISITWRRNTYNSFSDELLNQMINAGVVIVGMPAETVSETTKKD